MFTSIGHPVVLWPGLLSSPSVPTIVPIPCLEVDFVVRDESEAVLSGTSISTQSSQSSQPSQPRRLLKGLVWAVKNNTDRRFEGLLQSLACLEQLRQDLLFAMAFVTEQEDWETGSNYDFNVVD